MVRMSSFLISSARSTLSNARAKSWSNVHRMSSIEYILASLALHDKRLVTVDLPFLKPRLIIDKKTHLVKILLIQ